MGAVLTLSDLAAVGNFVSGFAVVVSFAFLALQLRQSNLNQRSLMQQGRSARTVDLLMRITDPKLSETAMRAFRGDPTMSEVEHFAFYGYAAAIFWNYEDSFLQFRAGMLDAKSWESDLSTIRRLFTNPAYRAAWRAARGGIGDDYRVFIDGLMDDIKGEPPRMVQGMMKQYLAEEIAQVRPTASAGPV
jgi:hypothetical protein